MARNDVIYLGRDNSIDVALMVKNVPYDAINEDRFIFKLTPTKGGSATVIDSASGGGDAYFDNSEEREVGGYTINVVKLKMGGAPISKGRYIGELTTFQTGVHDNGIVWGEFPVEAR
jgi:hypothetical protein